MTAVALAVALAAALAGVAAGRRRRWPGVIMSAICCYLAVCVAVSVLPGPRLVVVP